MAIDQAPEHANAVIESGTGAIVITDDASPIRRWMVAWPVALLQSTNHWHMLKCKWKSRQSAIKVVSLTRYSSNYFTNQPSGTSLVSSNKSKPVSGDLKQKV